jgi:serine/threonine protein kinase
VYESEHSIYIVQELLDRTLHNYLQKFGFPDTNQTRKLLYQLLIGLRYLHKINIMHRDIKLENILIRGAAKDNISPVIVDFGLAEYENSKEFVYIRCGTPGYVAPEVINLSKEEKS